MPTNQEQPTPEEIIKKATAYLKDEKWHGYKLSDVCKTLLQLHKDLEIARKENEIMREGLGEFDDLSWVKKIFKVLEAIK